jgi:oligopeptide/dipeptide ABC transporter ATP-binding protein
MNNASLTSRDILLEVENLRVYFYTRKGIVKAVDGVSFNILKGEVFGLVGESGCGKSTTGLAIMRLIQWPGRIIDGRIIFKNEDLLKKSEDEMRRIRGSKISMIFQEPTTSLNPVFTVGEQVAESIMIHQSVERREAQVKVLEMLRKVGIAEPERVAKQYPHELSGGMAQRVMIAIAFSCNPDLLIADEPTTALDVTIEAQILELMKDLVREMGTSVLLITHDLGIVAENCNRVAVMYAGKIVEIADVKTIFKKPMHPYTVALLQAIPKFQGRKQPLPEIEGVVPSLIDPPSGCRFHPRCKQSKNVCSKQEPRLLEVEPGHLVSCFHIGEPKC